MLKLRTSLTAAIAGAGLLSGAVAGQVSVSESWFRALPGGLPAGGYFKLHNGTDRTIVLKAAQSPACGMLMLHRSVHTSGMEHMMPAGDLEVAPGGTLEFAPGGYHLMCMDPAPAMRPGAVVTVTLEFADGSGLNSDFAVRGASGK